MTANGDHTLTTMDRSNLRRHVRELNNILKKQEHQLDQAKHLLRKIATVAGVGDEVDK